MRSLYKIFHPEVFQGSMKKKNYFEGWYFKHVSEGADEAFAVIPGISLSEDTHAFIQFNDSKTGKSSYFRYDISEFSFESRKLRIMIAGSIFTTEGINLDLSNEDCTIKGKINYSDNLKIRSHILRPGIMGWYSYVPWMECNHAVVSVSHVLEGSVTINRTSIQLGGGKGYIEKDWGISFPESWLWMQCNNFTSQSASVMISVGKIPWRGSFFIGFVAYFSIEGKTEILATFNGAEIIELSRKGENTTEVIIRKKGLVLRAVISKKGAGVLKAPVSGKMNNIIKESIDSTVLVELRRSGKPCFSENGVKAGYEETENIFSYFS
jgi:tocopherol cyclase